MTPASPEKPCPDPRGWAELPAPAEAEHSAQCLCQGEGCFLNAATNRLTVIKPCCQVMVGLGRHPGETEALSTLRGITCLDGAHLKRGDALHLGGQGRAIHGSQPSLPQGWELPGVGAQHCSAPPTLCRCLGSPRSATCTGWGGSLGAGPDREHRGGEH